MADPIALHPRNPHYFLFRGEPTILITSAEHYGSVINLDFDYAAYLDILAAHRLNYTRIYAGAYVEPEDYFIHDNILGPRIGRYCLPWARSDRPGWALGGNLFDLDAWNPDYFTRLKDFITCASQRGIVVEICFYNAMYPDLWERMPLNQANNIQGVGGGSCADFQTLKEARLTAVQEAYVQKITREVNAFDNVILEICDEPGLHGTKPEDYGPWIEHMVAAICAAERELPHKHLIAQQVCGPLGGAGDFSVHPDVAVITGQYIQDTDGAQIGGMHLLDTKYRLDKPIELNETGFYPIWYEGDREAAARVEAWEFLLGGGGGFNQLNGLFSTYNPTAANTNNEVVLNGHRILKDFLYAFDFIQLRRDAGLVAEVVPAGAFIRGISQPGEQYAVYLHHSRLDPIKYIVQPGAYQERISLRIPSGSYLAEWIDPASGEVIASETFQHSGDLREFLTPTYTIDIALRILKSK